MLRSLSCLILTLLVQGGCSLSSLPHSSRKAISQELSVNNEQSVNEVPSRRAFLSSFSLATAGILGGTVLSSIPEDAVAVDAVQYKSGKTPIVPGQKPRDKSDLKGTKKDPDFLRSVADCRNQCQSTNGPDGFAKSKEDCLSECQDICCTTYEQCTFNIVPRL